MPPIFEIHTDQSKEILRRTAARIMRGKLIAYGCIWIAVGTAFAIFVAVRRLENAYFFAALLWMGCASFSVYRYDSVPRRYAEKTYSSMVTMYGQPVSTWTLVYEDHFTVDNPLQRTNRRYGFDQCTLLLEDKKVFLLRTEKKSYIILDRAGFVQGDSEQFPAFIRSKIGPAQQKTTAR